MPPGREPGTPGLYQGKAPWRAWARRVRGKIDPVAAGGLIASSLTAWDLYRTARRVLVYLAFGDEPDLRSLLKDDKEFFATRTPAGQGELSLHRLDIEELERHRFGFLQPPASAAPVGVGEIELVLVPGLAFDLSGNRLGFGKGFYDRLLAGMDPAVPRVGVTPAALLVPHLPCEEHDISMTHLATEDGVFPVADPRE